MTQEKYADRGVTDRLSAVVLIQITLSFGNHVNDINIMVRIVIFSIEKG